MLASLFRGSKRPGHPERRPLLHGSNIHAEPSLNDASTESSYASDNPPARRTLLPLFSAAHLDRIPVYHLQHSIRVLVLRKCETTLSWDQLRSPQISQFLVKPIQQEIRASHYSRATLYALLANCLQFQKDGQHNPGSVGVSRTRALICELLAMRLLRDSSTRELIDALFYDFDPLQGLPIRTGTATPISRSKAHARISTVEIAIRAHAKRFLAHPLVVQQLEAVWAGTIVFHSTADTLHRPPSKIQSPVGFRYGAVGISSAGPAFPSSHHKQSSALGKRKEQDASFTMAPRRSVTLYDPSEASLFKLSRLRVPRYRQLFSTISYAIMICLFLAVLVDRSLDITGLELVFWFWSAGYMLDELVGFSEQGFGLYIMSVWNSFDIGILSLFVIYYILRLYGVVMPDAEQKKIASMAYDVLASTAVLLFPRLFSVLDHYPYFSQLLIAFRMMAVDLAAILILIVISCSGFFVAFTLSFSGGYTSAASSAYALFQMLMGFTPAAWEVWDEYNILAKAILGLFLIICHFLIVTILITVLTNSFMSIVKNANEEHQFLFAVNTISMVKSDALFSYVPPTNILGWFFSPLRFILPFRKFVKMNRTVIKITHIPILFSIFIYERLLLSPRVYEPVDLVEQRGRQPNRMPAFTLRGANELYSPGVQLREPSVSMFHKDRALEEVFRRPFQGPRPDRQNDFKDGGSDYGRSKSNTVVQDWMIGVGREGATSPVEQPQSVLDHLESRRPSLRRHRTAQHHPSSRRYSSFRSAASEPDEPPSISFVGFHPIHEDTESPFMSSSDLHQQTDNEGDDEFGTNDEYEPESADQSPLYTIYHDDSDKENSGPGPSSTQRRPLAEMEVEDTNRDHYVPATPTATQPPLPMNTRISPKGKKHSSPELTSTQQRLLPSKRDRGQHIRTASSATILFAPLEDLEKTSAISASPPKKAADEPARDPAAPFEGTSSRPHSPRRRHHLRVPTGHSESFLSAEGEDEIGHFPPRQKLRSAPNLASFLALSRRKPSFNAVALDLASDLGDNRTLPDIGVLSGSWGTQMESQMAAMRRNARPFNPLLGSAVSEDPDNDNEDEDEDARELSPIGRGDTRRLNRIMLARMTNLEEGFREVLREVKVLNRSRAGTSIGGDSEGQPLGRRRKDKYRPEQPVESRKDGDRSSV